MMDLSPSETIAIGAIMFLAGVIQATVGFAGGLFGIPLLVRVGLSLPQAVMVSLIGSLVQSATGAYQLRREIDPRITIRPALIRLITLPVGVYVLGLSQSLPADQIKQLIGVVLLAIVFVQWQWQPAPREKLHAAWEWFALGLSGFMAGFCGMGGPAMVLWVMAHCWSAAKSRAFLFFVFAAGMVPQMLLYWWRFGDDVESAMVLGLVGVVITLAGTFVGLRLGAGLAKHRLRRIAYGLLTLIALDAILSPLYSGRATQAGSPKSRQAAQNSIYFPGSASPQNRLQ
jgi:uncharacterized membrane protein YfcA